MKKIFRIIMTGSLVLVVIYTFVFLYQKSKPVPEKFDILKPQVMDIEKKTVATGKVEPRDEVLIKPQISGIITEIYKEAGQMIRVGDAIAKVKVIPEMNQLSNAQSNVRQTRINLDLAQSEFDRVCNLYNDKVVSKEDYDKAFTSLNTAKESSQSAVDNLEIVTEGISKRSGEFNNTVVRSTISGMILDVPVKVGNSVILSNTFNDGTTIASVADMNDMIFRGTIDETEVGQLKEGMELELSVGALQDMTTKARLEYIAPKGTESNGAIMFEIKAAIEIPKSIFLRAGYSANAEIILDKRGTVLSIPESSLFFSGDSTYVFKLTGSGEEQTFEKLPVTVGLSDGINIPQH